MLLYWFLFETFAKLSMGVFFCVVVFKEPKGRLMFCIIVSENQFPFAIFILAGVTHFLNFRFS